MGGNRDQQVAPPVELSQRLCRLPIGTHPNANCLCAIVFALLQAAAARIAAVSVFRWAADQMENGAAIEAGAASAEPIDNLVEAQLVRQDGVERYTKLLENALQSLGLSNGSRRPVKQESPTTAETLGSLPDHLDDQLVRDQFAPPHGLERRTHRRAGVGVARRRTE
jgi:hypothetical protein